MRTNPLLPSHYLLYIEHLLLIQFKTGKAFFVSILTPNTRSLTLMILHLKPKVVNVMAKSWFIRNNLQQKYSIFSLIFPLYKYFAKHIHQECPVQPFLPMLLLTQFIIFNP